MLDDATDSKISDELDLLTYELEIGIPVRRGVEVVVHDLTDDELLRHTVVGSAQVDLNAGHVSASSPMGDALLRARQGKEIVVELPGGERRFKVLQVRVNASEDARQLIAWILGEPASPSLGDLPWLFAADPAQVLHKVHGVAGGRSVDLDMPWVLVAASVDTEIETGDDDRAAVVDVMRPGARRLYRVRGKAILRRSNGSSITIETAASSDSADVEYRLQGTRRAFGRERTPVFLGRPAMREWRDGEQQGVVPECDLQWMPDVSGTTWKSLSDCDLVVGAGTLRYVDGDVVRRSVRLRTLPERAAVELHTSTDPRRGEVRLLRFGEIEASVGERLHARTSGDSDEYRLELTVQDEKPPRDVIVRVDWPGPDGLLGTAELRLPFPTEHAAFFGPRGQELSPGSALTTTQLAGARAEVVAAGHAMFEVQGRYVGKDATKVRRRRDRIAVQIPATSPGHYALDLAAVQSAVEDALAHSRDLDGAVQLRICGARGGMRDARGTSAPRPAYVSVMRFDLKLERRDADSSVLDLDKSSRSKLTAADLADLDVEALFLLDPDLKPTSLKRASKTGWLAPEQDFGPGPYLVVGGSASRRRLWPLIWHVGPATPQSKRAPRRPKTIAEAYASRLDGTEAVEAFQSVALRMAEQPGIPDWELFFGGLRERSLPVQIFPLLEGFAKTPKACAMAAVKAGQDDFEIVWKRMEETFFAWWQVPHCCWRDVLEAYAAHEREQAGALGDTDMALRPFRDDIHLRIERLKARLTDMDDAFESVRAKLTET